MLILNRLSALSELSDFIVHNCEHIMTYIIVVSARRGWVSLLSLKLSSSQDKKSFKRLMEYNFTYFSEKGHMEPCFLKGILETRQIRIKALWSAKNKV